MKMILPTLVRSTAWLAALCLILIAALVSIQVLGRIADRVLVMFGQPAYGLSVPSLAEISGFLLACASFLALADALQSGSHIRVSILLDNLSGRPRRALETVSVILAVGVTAYATWHVGRLAYDSYRFGEVSYGIIPVPLVLPQAVMTFGLAILLLALVVHLVIVVRHRPPYREAQGAAADHHE